MKLWQIALTIYCFINVGFNFILLTLNLKTAKLDKSYVEKQLQMGQDICNSNEQLKKIEELEKRVHALTTRNLMLIADNEELIEKVKQNE